MRIKLLVEIKGIGNSDEIVDLPMERAVELVVDKKGTFIFDDPVTRPKRGKK